MRACVRVCRVAAVETSSNSHRLSTLSNLSGILLGFWFSHISMVFSSDADFLHCKKLPVISDEKQIATKV